MAIDPNLSTSSAPPPLLRLTKSSAVALPTGQPLQATVLKVQGNNITLALAGRLIEAQTTTLRLMTGMALTVRVEEENGQQLLRITPPEAPAQNTTEQALRQALPRQAPLRELFQRIASFDHATKESAPAGRAPSTPPTPGATLTPGSPPMPEAGTTAPARASAAPLPASTPPTPAQIAAPLLRMLPPLVQLTSGEGLRQALLNSGMFMEQKLAQGDSAGLRGDLKVNLLRMVQQLVQHSGAKEGATTPRAGSMQELSPELLQLLKDGEAALARIQLHQLAALPRNDGPEPQWLFELPLRLPQQEQEVLRLRIQREQRGNGNGNEPCWSVTLELSDAQQQPLRVVVTYLGGSVSTTFWATQAETAELFRNHLEELRGRLAAQGLEVGRLGSFTGQPLDNDCIEKLGSGLLREKA